MQNTKAIQMVDYWIESINGNITEETRKNKVYIVYARYQFLSRDSCQVHPIMSFRITLIIILNINEKLACTAFFKYSHKWGLQSLHVIWRYLVNLQKWNFPPITQSTHRHKSKSQQVSQCNQCVKQKKNWNIPLLC